MDQGPQGEHRGHRGARLAILGLALACFGCDHATKAAAEMALGAASARHAIPLYDGIVELRWAPNHDTAFSLLQRFGISMGPGVLLAAAGAVLLAAVVTWIVRRRQLLALQHAGFALVVAGALGNVVDRAVRGYVVDFIHVGWWPVFNVADVAVVIGMVLLAFPLRAKPEVRAL